MISNWYYFSVYDQSFLWNYLFQIKAGSELQKSYDPVAQDLYNNPHHNKLIKNGGQTHSNRLPWTVFIVDSKINNTWQLARRKRFHSN